MLSLPRRTIACLSIQDRQLRAPQQDSLRWTPQPLPVRSPAVLLPVPLPVDPPVRYRFSPLQTLQEPQQPGLLSRLRKLTLVPLLPGGTSANPTFLRQPPRQPPRQSMFLAPQAQAPQLPGSR